MPYIENTKINRDLVLDLFLTISRFEFALKATRFKSGNEQRVDPNWIEYGEQINDRFENNMNGDLAIYCDYIFAQPPKKQILVNDNLDWSDEPPNNAKSKTGKLLELVKRIRNNVFHGGKYNDQYQEETARNETLIKAAIEIVKACVEMEDDVRKAYKETAV